MKARRKSGKGRAIGVEKVIADLSRRLETAAAEFYRHMGALQINPTDVARALNNLKQEIEAGRQRMARLVTACASPSDRARAQSFASFFERAIAELYDPTTAIGAEMAKIEAASTKMQEVDADFADTIAGIFSDEEQSANG